MKLIETLWTGGNCRAWGFHLPNGRYIVATDMDGIRLPSPTDWMIAVYRDEAAWENDDGTADVLSWADRTEYASDEQAAAMLAVACAMSQAGYAPTYDTDEIACLQDPARGDEAREMLEDRCARCGYDSLICAALHLWLARRDNIRPALTAYWRGVLDGARRIMVANGIESEDFYHGGRA